MAIIQISFLAVSAAEKALAATFIASHFRNMPGGSGSRAPAAVQRAAWTDHPSAVAWRQAELAAGARSPAFVGDASHGEIRMVEPSTGYAVARDLDAAGHGLGGRWTIDLVPLDPDDGSVLAVGDNLFGCDLIASIPAELDCVGVTKADKVYEVWRAADQDGGLADGPLAFYYAEDQARDFIKQIGAGAPFGHWIRRVTGLRKESWNYGHGWFPSREECLFEADTRLDEALNGAHG